MRVNRFQCAASAVRSFLNHSFSFSVRGGRGRKSSFTRRLSSRVCSSWLSSDIRELSWLTATLFATDKEYAALVLKIHFDEDRTECLTADSIRNWRQL